MTRPAYEDVLSEYAGLQSSLADPRVHRDHLRARRLRRCLAALEPLHATAVRLRAAEEDLAAALELGWDAEVERLSARAAELRAGLDARLALRDPRDPFDVVVFLEGDAPLVAALARDHRRLAGERGWSVQDLDGGPGSPPFHRAAYAVTAREGADGPWAALKSEPRRHAGPVKVTVVPEGVDAPDLKPEDLRIDLYCTRRPEQPPDVWLTHLPSGVQVRGAGANRIEARAAALRQIRALITHEARTPPLRR